MDRQIIESSAVLDNVTSQQAVVMYIDVYLPQLRRRCLFLLTNTRRGGDDALPYTRYRNDMECVLSRQNEPTSRNSNASRRYRLHRYATAALPHLLRFHRFRNNLRNALVLIRTIDRPAPYDRPSIVVSSSFFFFFNDRRQVYR